MLVLMLLVWCQVTWWRLEARTTTVEKALDAFRADWTAAKAVVAPDTVAELTFPEEAVTVEGKRVPARTRWTGLTFVTEADWRAVAAADDALRRRIAVHEACHLADSKWLQSRQLTSELRWMLEMRAETYGVVYEATR